MLSNKIVLLYYQNSYSSTVIIIYSRQNVFTDMAMYGFMFTKQFF